MSKKRRNLVNDMKYHYTYRITNIKERMYYYGVHSCDCLPEEEIGITYWSTSKRDGFVKHQKEHPEDYKYKVLKIFDTRVEAVQHEIFLHKKFDVKLHPKFYNDSNQRSTGFDTSGKEPWNKGKVCPQLRHTKSDETKLKISQNRSGIKQTEEQRHVNSETKKGMIYIIKDGIMKKVYKEKLDDFLSDGWIKGKLPTSQDTIEKIKKGNSNKVTINNGYTEVRIHYDLFDEYIKNGWVKGKLNPKTEEHIRNHRESILGKTSVYDLIENVRKMVLTEEYNKHKGTKYISSIKAKKLGL